MVALLAASAVLPALWSAAQRTASAPGRPHRADCTCNRDCPCRTGGRCHACARPLHRLPGLGRFCPCGRSDGEAAAPLPQLDESLLTRVAVLCAPGLELADAAILSTLPSFSLVAERGHPS